MININYTSQLRSCQYNQQFPLIKFLQKFVLFNQNVSSVSQELEMKYKAWYVKIKKTEYFYYLYFNIFIELLQFCGIHKMLAKKLLLFMTDRDW